MLAVVVCGMGRTIRRIALGEAGRIGKAGRIEEGVVLIDACVDVADLYASSRIRSAASAIPGAGRIDDLMALAQIRMVKGIVLDALHHRRALDCI